MAANPREVREAHAEADKYEPRLQRVLLRALAKITQGIPMDALQRAIATRDVKAAMKLIPEEVIEDALQPAAQLLADVHMRGQKLAVEEVAKKEVEREV